MTYEILSMISARFPPVSLWMRTAVTKNLASMVSTRSEKSMSACRKGIPRFCSSKIFWNSGPTGAGISCATSCRAPVKAWPARSDRENISRVSGNRAVNCFSRRRFLWFTTREGRENRREPAATERTTGHLRKKPIRFPHPKRTMERRTKVPTVTGKSPCLSHLSIRTARRVRPRIRFSRGTSLRSSLLRKSGRSSSWRLRILRRESRFLTSSFSDRVVTIRNIPPSKMTRTETNTSGGIQSMALSLRASAVREHIRGEVDSGRGHHVGELRPDSRCAEHPQDFPFLVDPLPLEQEDVLHRDDVPFHPRNFGHLDNPAGPVAQTRHLDDDVQRGAHLLPDGFRRNLESRHQHHRFEASQRVAGGIGVDGRDGSVVPGVHRLEHVERLSAPDLADDDPVGPHAKRVPDKIALRHGSPALDVGRPGLEAHHVFLLENQLGGILDGHDPFRIRDRRREDVEEGGLAHSRPPGHQDIQPGAHHRVEYLGHFLGQRPVAEEVLHPQGIHAEPPDRN